MNYHEAMNTMVTRTQAKREIKAHGLRWKDFLAELGELTYYKGSDVLNWLGY